VRLSSYNQAELQTMWVYCSHCHVQFYSFTYNVWLLFHSQHKSPLVAKHVTNRTDFGGCHEQSLFLLLLLLLLLPFY